MGARTSVGAGGGLKLAASCVEPLVGQGRIVGSGVTAGEGETYVGHTTADASGAFTVTVSYLTKPYLTATAADAISGTSEFSGVFMATVPLAPGSGTVFLPLLIK